MRRFLLACLYFITTFQQLDGKKNISCSLLGTALFFNETRTTSLHLRQLHDGLGAEMQHVLYAFSYASFRRWNFPGYFNYTWGKPHGLDAREYMDFFWGDGTILENSHNPNTLPKIVELKRSRDIVKATDAANVAYMVNSDKFDLDKIAKTSSLDKYLSPSLRASLRSVASCGVQASLQKFTVFRPNHTKRLTVAAHIRRGDVHKDSKIAHARYVSDELFIGVMSAIKTLYPHAELHAFTSFMRLGNKSKTMEMNYRAHNISLHITDESSGNNTEQSLNAIAHFVTADVFIMSKSSFSTVPAYYNPNCVIYVPFWHGPLAHYIKLPNNVEDVAGAVMVVKRDLPACVSTLTSQRYS